MKINANNTWLAKPFTMFAVLVALLTISGFWMSYYSRLPFDVSDKNPIVQVHALVFTSWLAVLVIQARLAATGRTKQHMKVGQYGVALGVLLFVTGMAITWYVFDRAVAEQGPVLAAKRSIYPLVDMLLFGPLFALAIYYRKKPVIHKKLIVVAVSTMLIAPAFRLLYALGLQDMTWLRLFLWVLPLMAVQIHDWIKGKGTSKIYISSILLIPASGPLRDMIADTQVYASLAIWIAGGNG